MIKDQKRPRRSPAEAPSTKSARADVTKVPHQLDEQVLQYIGGLRLREGDRLPTERELSATLTVSRAALRTSLARLERDGVLWRHIGKGTFFGPRPNVEGRSLISLINSVMSPYNLLEFQLLVEPACCSLTALRANSQDIEKLRHAINRMGAAQSVDEFNIWDNRFHLHIVEFSKNNLISGIFEALSAEKSFRIFGDLRAAMTTPERREIYMAQHVAVYDAIQKRDAQAAETAMREHLSRVGNDVLQLDAGFKMLGGGKSASPGRGR